MGKIKECYRRWIDYCNSDKDIEQQHLDDEYHYQKWKKESIKKNKNGED
jgi:hypothetical protein|tara:strand:- start:715 stop:861 length:147 start_codon:yes stop_codon:yes gene_type:complete